MVLSLLWFTSASNFVANANTINWKKYEFRSLVHWQNDGQPFFHIFAFGRPSPRGIFCSHIIYSFFLLKAQISFFAAHQNSNNNHGRQSAGQLRQRLLLQKNQENIPIGHIILFLLKKNSPSAQISLRFFLFARSLFVFPYFMCKSFIASPATSACIHGAQSMHCDRTREKRQCECESMRKIAHKLMNTRIRQCFTQQTRIRIRILLKRLSAGDAAILRARVQI